MTTTPTPTHESYGEFDAAFEHFNHELFDAKLPSCLVTLQRSKKYYGYFWGNKFEEQKGNRVIDEIAMNPDTFKTRTDKEVLSTLVHEMVHLWQHRFGDASRNGYHNREWARKMESVGLMPSVTGLPGGARIGQKCSHYIVNGGDFDIACNALLEAGFVITWRSLPAPVKTKPQRAGQRAKYECPECGAAVWGREGLNIHCGDCAEPMETVS